MPFISVVVPVYNVEKYMERCVTSLVTQAYNDCEVILVDDGSTDTSGEICERLAETIPCVSVYHKPNGGLSSARNYGMERAKGSYVTFVDSDDWVQPDYFAVLDGQLRKNMPDMLKFGYTKVYQGVQRGITVPCYPEGLYIGAHIHSEILPKMIGPVRLFDYSKVPLMSACSCAYSRDFLTQNQISFSSEREVLNEDYLFNYHAMLCAQCIEVSHKILYLYDYREGSLSKRYVKDMLGRKKKLLAAYKDLLNQYGLYQRYEQAYFGGCVDSYYACVTNECGQWSDSQTAVSNIMEILNEEGCVSALRNCNHKDLGIKGFAIYYLMRLKMAFPMYVLYRMIKGNN